MPELPEVESVVRALRRSVTGAKVSAVRVLWDRSIAVPTARGFCEALQSRSFEHFSRRGKFILASLSGGLTLAVHLRMSGRLISLKQSPQQRRHLRVEICLQNSHSLCFFDVRKFGRMYLVENESEVVGKLGPDPLCDDLSGEKWYSMLNSRAAAIKPLLLRQDFLAGLGNIYADEVLWQTRIHPTRLASTLSRKKSNELLTAIVTTLERAISCNGTDFGDGVVDKGLYIPDIYGRDGERCHRCGRTIKRIVVGGRGTHLCPGCQRSEGR